MKSRRFAGAALALVFAATWATAQTADVVVTPDQVKWMPIPFAPGAKVAWLMGGPDKTELYTLRVHLDAGAKIPPHTHPDTRMITVLSGEVYAGSGAIFSEEATKIYGPGTFYVVPAGAPHFTWAKTGDVVYQESGTGPSPTNLIKP